eukprot:m.469460 g.469460  ORF g.469460 m.469460 type:complete len:105 (-) comp28586_c0_seq1:45-359(-)
MTEHESTLLQRTFLGLPTQLRLGATTSICSCKSTTGVFSILNIAHAHGDISVEPRSTLYVLSVGGTTPNSSSQRFPSESYQVHQSRLSFSHSDRGLASEVSSGL